VTDTRSAAFVLEGVTVRRPGPDGGAARAVLDGVDAEIPTRGTTVLWGPSGAGKTTLLRLLNRLDVPDAGVVRYRGTPLDDLDPLALRREVGMVFQHPTPFAGTVRDNLHVAAPDADDDRLGPLLERVSLPQDLLGRDADTLSGGELQRMCLARSLVVEPRVLLLDEPTSALDAEPRRTFERTVADLARDGLTVVWVSHDGPQVERVADRVLEVAGGHVHPRDVADLHLTDSEEAGR
jgi:putative ABC transport system ATP-binding protein